MLINEAGKTFVVFEYIITNTSATTAMSATLTYTDDSASPNAADANIKVYAYTSATAVSQPFSNVSTIKGANEANLKADHASLISGNVAANGTAYFYVAVAVDNLANDAEFSGIFSWQMTKASA